MATPTIDEVKLYSIREVAQMMDLPPLEVNRRIRKKDIVAEKVGWFWVIKGEAVLGAMSSDWYRKHLQNQ